MREEIWRGIYGQAFQSQPRLPAWGRKPTTNTSREL